MEGASKLLHTDYMSSHINTLQQVQMTTEFKLLHHCLKTTIHSVPNVISKQNKKLVLHVFFFLLSNIPQNSIIQISTYLPTYTRTNNK